MTDPPQECPTRTTSPSARSIALLVAVTSSARDVVGFCTEITLYPWSTSGLITLLQEEPSAQSPWTKTIVGFVFMEAAVCANAFEASDKTPTNNRVPIFFMHASNCIGKGREPGVSIPISISSNLAPSSRHPDPPVEQPPRRSVERSGARDPHTTLRGDVGVDRERAGRHPETERLVPGGL